MSKIGKGLAILLGVTTIAAGGMAGGMYIGETNYKNKTIEMEAQDKTELEEMAEQLEAMSLILDEQEEEITSLRSTKTSLETDKANLQAEVSAKQTTITGLNAQIAELEAQGEADSTTIATLTSQKTSLEAEVSEKQTAIAGLNAQIAELEAQGETDAETISTLTSQKTALETEVSEKQSTISTLNSQISELETQAQANGATIESLNTQVSGLQSEVETKQATITSLNTQISTLQGTISDKQTQLDSLTSQLSTLQAAHTELQSQYSALETSNGELDVQIATLQGQIVNLQAQINAINPDEVLMGKILNASLREELTMYTPTNLALPSKTFDDESGIITLDGSIGTYYYDSTTKTFRKISQYESLAPTNYSDGIYYSFNSQTQVGKFVDTNKSNFMPATITFNDLSELTSIIILPDNNYLVEGFDNQNNAVVEVFGNNSNTSTVVENVNAQNLQVVHHNGVEYLYSVDEAVDGSYRFYNVVGNQIIAISKSNTIVASVVDDVDTIFVYAVDGDSTDLVYYSPNMQAPAAVPEHDNLYVDYGNIILEKDGEYFDLQGNDIFASQTVLGQHTTTRHNIDGNVFYTVVDPTVERMWFSIGDGEIGLPMVWDDDVTYTYALPEVYDETEGEDVVVSSFAELQAYFAENATVLAYINAQENELTAMFDEGINPVIVISRTKNNEVLTSAYAIYSSFGFQTFVTPDVGYEEEEFDDDEEVVTPAWLTQVVADGSETYGENAEITGHQFENTTFYTIMSTDKNKMWVATPEEGEISTSGIGYNANIEYIFEPLSVKHIHDIELKLLELDENTPQEQIETMRQGYAEEEAERIEDGTFYLRSISVEESGEIGGAVDILYSLLQQYLANFENPQQQATKEWTFKTRLQSIIQNYSNEGEDTIYSDGHLNLILVRRISSNGNEANPIFINLTVPKIQ